MAGSAKVFAIAAAAALAAALAMRLGTAFCASSPSSSGAGAGATVVLRRGAAAAGARSPAVESAAFSGSADRGSAAASFAVALIAIATAGLARASASRRRRDLVTRRANLVATSPAQAIPWWDRLSKPRTEHGIGIWAEKLNMTTIFEDGPIAKTISATILCVKQGGNIVTAKRWPERHGSYQIEVGYDRCVPEPWEKRGKRGKKLAALEVCGIPPLKKFRRFRMRPQDWVKYEIGQKLWPSDIFKEGDLVDIHGRSRGKGFQGAIKRWGHARGPMTHGSKHHRRYGSVGTGTYVARVLPFIKRPGWTGDTNHIQRNCKILKIMDRLDDANMPETIIVVEGSVPGYAAHTDAGGSYVYMHHKLNRSDGRFKRDPVWLWYVDKGEGVDPYVPIKGQAWTWKTFWGRDLRWITQEVKKYWPDGFPGYDHSIDPFYDGCSPKEALKAPEW